MLLYDVLRCCIKATFVSAFTFITTASLKAPNISKLTKHDTTGRTLPCANDTLSISTYHTVFGIPRGDFYSSFNGGHSSTKYLHDNSFPSYAYCLPSWRHSRVCNSAGLYSAWSGYRSSKSGRGFCPSGKPSKSATQIQFDYLWLGLLQIFLDGGSFKGASPSSPLPRESRSVMSLLIWLALAEWHQRRLGCPTRHRPTFFLDLGLIIKNKN